MGVRGNWESLSAGDGFAARAPMVSSQVSGGRLASDIQGLILNSISTPFNSESPKA